MRSWIFVLMLIFPAGLIAEVLDIGIYRNQQVEKLVLTPAVGTYEIFGDGKKLRSIKPSDPIRLYVHAGRVSVRSISGDHGSYNQVTVSRNSHGNIFRIQPTQPKGREGKYNDNLVVTCQKGALKLINRVYLEHYVGGVVEAESGSKQNAEYYKLQSIVCRTYALNNMRRHEEEGFHLCDQVHCQVYHGTSRFSELIPEAVSATKGLVVVDSDIKLVTTAFHSNCGGQTINAEDVWSMPLPYLQSVADTFCLSGKHAHWETRIPRQNWINYLRNKHGLQINDQHQTHTATNFNEDHLREVYYANRDSGIPLKEIRQDWNLKSTFFSVDADQDEVRISGRGFGHGVGMCQEGAMRMSDLGFTYSEIVHYYYKDVHIIDLSLLDFFQEY